MVEPDGRKLFTTDPHTGKHSPYPPSKPIAFSVAGALWDWNATHVIKTGIGASEESIVYLARVLGREKRDTSVYGPVPLDHGIYDEEIRESVKYWHHTRRRRIDPRSTVVVSRAPSYGKSHDELVGAPLDKILWLQDVGYADLTPATAADYRAIVAVSPWHKQHMIDQNGIEADKIHVIPNFVLREHFDGRNPIGRSPRLPHHFIYASSPDRGLVTLLKMWPHILARWPDATLSIFYGWAGAATLTNNNPTWTHRYQTIRRQYEQLRYQPGIMDYGRVNHQLLAREYQKASVWPYFSNFFETDCNAARKARAGGAIPVCTPQGGLLWSAKSAWTQYVQQPDGFDPDVDGARVEYHPGWEAYVKSCMAAVADAIDTSEEERAKMSAEALETGSIEGVLPLWKELLP
jgi:glycosyltransferase involved in cell wall biosynthesis